MVDDARDQPVPLGRPPPVRAVVAQPLGPQLEGGREGHVVVQLDGGAALGIVGEAADVQHEHLVVRGSLDKGVGRAILVRG